MRDIISDISHQLKTPLASLKVFAELLCDERVTYLTKERNQTIHIDCSEDAILICDGDWLVEGIMNLVKNASDYSEEGTTISLTAEMNPMYTRIYVEDEGMGIPEEELPHIFKRFYRVNKEVNPNSVGIGLSLTKSIV